MGSRGAVTVAASVPYCSNNILMTPAARSLRVSSTMKRRQPLRSAATGDRGSDGDMSHDVQAVRHRTLLKQKLTRYLAKGVHFDAPKFS